MIIIIIIFITLLWLGLMAILITGLLIRILREIKKIHNNNIDENDKNNMGHRDMNWNWWNSNEDLNDGENVDNWRSLKVPIVRVVIRIMLIATLMIWPMLMVTWRCDEFVGDWFWRLVMDLCVYVVLVLLDMWCETVGWLCSPIV